MKPNPIVAVALAIILAALSYYYVEDRKLDRVDRIDDKAQEKERCLARARQIPGWEGFNASNDC